MREIKFRIWDKKYQTFDYNASPELFISTEGTVFEKDRINFGMQSYDEYNEADYYEISQYTGLLDKNGKEIYEGDILKITCNFELRKGIEIDKVVWWEEGAYCCSDWTLFELIKNRKQGKQEFEIIGNIYENPDLINS